MLLSSLLVTSFALLCRAEKKVGHLECPQKFATFGCCPYYYSCLGDTPYMERCYWYDEGHAADTETRDCIQQEYVAACSPNNTADVYTLRGLTCDLLKRMYKTQEDERRNDVSPIPGRPYEVNCITSEGNFSIGCTRFYYLCSNYTLRILRCGPGRTYDTDRKECVSRHDIEECKDIVEGTGEAGLEITPEDDNDDEWDYEGEEFSGQDPTTIPTPCEAPAELFDFCADKPLGFYPFKPCSTSFVICQHEFNFTTLFTCMSEMRYDNNTDVCAKHGSVDACKDIPEDFDEGPGMP
ncbi:hypothetical protein PRIPAC_91931 [Pristionchus pacificus]|uniref:Carbohydrate-binding protein n=1 Tax=Pristionchus pacificus TaxID=54126 RepID=A0A2A6CI72_PRIPA|nr:hypothetical protein PRIPAC_91931 [Pristionchus pacificus]|eukprot:PDM77806.1 Carbohydrate-binding protein [Pristionchus pacificus]